MTFTIFEVVLMVGLIYAICKLWELKTTIDDVNAFVDQVNISMFTNIDEVNKNLTIICQAIEKMSLELDLCVLTQEKHYSSDWHVTQAGRPSLLSPMTTEEEFEHAKLKLSIEERAKAMNVDISRFLD